MSSLPPSVPAENVIMQEQEVDEEMYPGTEISVPSSTTPTSPVTQQTIQGDNSQSIDAAKKEGELSQREKELNEKEAALKLKEEELAYKPQLPSFIEKAEPEKIFVFNMNELSVGTETLFRMPYRLVDNPEEKKSMHDLWLEQGKVRAEVFEVEFKKVGEIFFRPIEGTCRFEQITSPIPADIQPEQSESVQAAFDSQKPTEPMLDATEPVTNVALPLGTDMGLNAIDVQGAFQDVIDKALKQYLNTKGI